jgi:hypothetical protein
MKKENDLLKSELHRMRKLEAGWDFRKGRRQDVEEIQIHNTYINEKNTQLVKELESLREELRSERKFKSQRENSDRELENQLKVYVQRQEDEKNARHGLEQDLYEMNKERENIGRDALKMKKELEWYRNEMKVKESKEGEQTRKLVQDNRTLLKENDKLRLRLKEIIKENDGYKKTMEEIKIANEEKTNYLSINAETHLVRHRKTQDELIKLQEEHNAKIVREKEYLNELEQNRKQIADLESYRSNVTNLERQLAQQQTVLNDNALLRRQVDEYDRKLQPLLQERTDLRRSKDDLNSQLTRVIEERRSIESRLVRIEAEKNYKERVVVKEDVNKSKELNRLIEIYKLELDDKSKQLSNLERVNTEYKENLQHLQLKLQESETRMRVSQDIRKSKDIESVRNLQITMEDLRIENEYLRRENEKIREMLQQCEMNNNLTREVVQTTVTQQPMRYVTQEQERPSEVIVQEKVYRNSETRYRLNSPTEPITKGETRIN